MTLHVAADSARCVGAGQCVMSAADVFDQDDGGTILVLDPNPPAELAAAVREAAYLCPASVITLTDDAA